MPHDANQAADLALVARVRAGDGAAREELIRKYTPMVKHIVRHHAAGFLDFDDLTQEGLIGLLGAIDEYRPEEFEVKFSSFAYLCILRKVYNAIKQTRGNKHRLLNEAVSLHSPAFADETRTVLDRVDDDAQPDPCDVVADKLMAQHLTRLLRNHLSLLEFTVVQLMMQGYTAAEIQRLVGVKAKTVDNARTRAKLKLRRIVERYGSLSDPAVPLKPRRRRDVYGHLRAVARR
ncbi:MAG: sigma-70 family RNA polymerase sigma factor [Limnochordales bacterium]|jgi:RNA polymerase sigma factor, sigma-70 family|nr:hypothetical protein [Bacillota bacterium]